MGCRTDEHGVDFLDIFEGDLNDVQPSRDTYPTDEGSLWVEVAPGVVAWARRGRIGLSSSCEVINVNQCLGACQGYLHAIRRHRLERDSAEPLLTRLLERVAELRLSSTTSDPGVSAGGDCG